MVILAFSFGALLAALVWGALLLFNVWVFQKTKGKGNLLMLIGAGCLSLSMLILAFHSMTSFPGEFVLFWLPFIGAISIVVGFYFTVKPLVDANLEALKQKLQETASEMKASEAPAQEPPAPKPEASEGGDAGAS